MLKRKVKLVLLFLIVVLFVSFRNPSGGAQTFVFRVTDVFLKADDPQPAARCPLTVTFHGHITANGPGTVRYTIAHSAGPAVPHDVSPHELVFRAAGTQRVSTSWTFNDVGAVGRYQGWEAIRILSPNPMESSHVTGGFMLNCPELQAVVDHPRLSTVGGTFLVSLNGFHVNRQTRDDALDRDGSGDEVFIRDANFRIDSTGAGRNISYSGTGTRSTIYHVHTGDSFPVGSPRDSDSLTLTAGIPHNYYRGEIIQGQTALVVFPTLWEWDSEDESPRRLGDQFLSMARDRHLDDFVSRLITHPPGTSISDFIKSGSEIGLPLTVTLGHGPLGLGEPGNRPIGMSKRDADTYVFDPKVLILTYEAANLISRTDFGHGPGIFEMRFQDDRDLEGDYTLFLQVKRLP